MSKYIIMIQIDNLEVIESQNPHTPIQDEIESWLTDLGYDISGIEIADASKPRLALTLFKAILTNAKGGAE